MEIFADAVKDKLSGEQTAVKHLDETGLRVAGKTRWIHVLCSFFLSHFRLGASRGDVPEYLLGKAVHDCFSSNWTLEGVEHGVCNSHTLRALEALIVFEKEPWASDMTTILLDALQLTKTARSQGRDAVDPEAIKEIELRMVPVANRLLRYTRTNHLSAPVETKEARSTEMAHRAQSSIAIQGPENSCLALS